MSKRIVVLSGSPRNVGNTNRLTEAFIEGAKTAGHQVSLFKVAGLTIGGCRGCGYCFKHKGVCVQKDDMPPILDGLCTADALALTSPVYYFGVSAQLKLAVDRFFALLEEGMAVKRTVLLMTCGDATDAAAAPSISMFRQLCAYQKWEEAGIIIAPRLHNPGEIDGRAELEQAKKLGENI
ncbi:MAG: flavodoxin family protein [Deltaproteobacteria bacterium]|jgi:multimeric flavodoxin WrbA|nr:flavodoxin family protein [Deltaproteobacteria bacterium]